MPLPMSEAETARHGDPRASLPVPPTVLASFKEQYRAICGELDVDPHPTVLALENAGGKPLRLVVSARTLGPRGATAIARAVASLGVPLLESLSLPDCFIGDEGCDEVCQAVSAAPGITALDVSGAHIKTAGAKALAGVIAAGSLAHLRLEWNGVGADSATFTSICDGVARSRTLLSIDLRNNRIGPDGAANVARAIKVNRTLTALDLQWNKIGAQGGESILAALHENTSLTELRLTGCEVAYQTTQSIAQVLQRNADRQRDAERAVTLQQIQLEELERERLRVDRRERDFEAREQQLSEQLRASQSAALAATKQERESAQLLLREKEAELAACRAELEMVRRDAAHDRCALEERARDAEKQLELERDNLKRAAADRERDAERAREEVARVTRDAAAAQDRLREDLDAARRELDAARGSVAAAERQTAQSEAERGRAADRQADLADQLRRAREEASAQREALDRAERKREEADARRDELEDRIRKRDHADAQAAIDAERDKEALRQQLRREQREEVAQAERKTLELQDLLKAKDKQLASRGEELERIGERHARELDAVEARRREALDKVGSFEVERGQLAQRIASAESERRRAEELLRCADVRVEQAKAESQRAERGHQQELERLSERFATDRLTLERRVVQQQSRLEQCERERRSVEDRLKRVQDERDREVERMQRRMLDCVRTVFEDRQHAL
eukprot:TRINITY_DN5261_c0_g1_i1.p1 TRINITY_DN5261_c0_g1~~TRINITY_DN5261_c0_g1_i1.p1  ORF type:complete len:694 (+),score=256.42 TRINITY_DN5261_c0_g1_i1:104-2185(+)